MLRWSVNIGFLREHPFYASICLPHECKKEDIEQIFASGLVRELIHPLELQLLSTESYTDEWKFSGVQIFAILSLFSLVILTAVVSALNYLHPELITSQSALAFDAVANVSRLTVQRKNRESITAMLDVFRVFFTITGFFVHVLYGMSGALTFRAAVFESNNSPYLTQFAKVIPINVGIICIIAATRSSFLWLTAMSGKRIKFSDFMAIRVLRSLPVLAASMLVVATFPLLRFIGPFGPRIQEYTLQNCWDNGWREFLFSSNFLPINRMCNIVNWHLSVDLQLYAASFPVLALMARRPTTGLTVLLLLMTMGTILSGAHLQSLGLKVHLNSMTDRVHTTLGSMHSLMFHTVHYIPVYGSGVVLGFVLWRQSGIKKPVGVWKSVIMVAVLPIAFVTGICHAYDNNFDFFIDSPTLETLYTYLVRLVSSVLWCILSYAFLNASHPLILWISNCKPLFLLSRLSFSMFATHSLVIHWVYASLEVQMMGSTFLVVLFMAVMCLSVLSALVMYILVEAPFANLATLFMTAGKTRPGKKSS